MAAPVTFRVHFAGGDVVDVVATDPNTARDTAQTRKGGGIVTMVKVLKGA